MIKRATYRTSAGTFEIELRYAGASPLFHLSLDGKSLGPYTYADLSAKSISTGDHDDEIGVSGADLEVPGDLAHWVKHLSSMASGPRTAKPAAKPDADRRQLLVHIDAERVKKLKKAAIDLDQTASDIVEEALQAWLDKFDKRKS